MTISLCLICQAIDFRRYLREPIPHSVKLGSWEQIRERTRCIFCRLVHDAFLLHARRPLSGSNIYLSNEWSWKCCISYNEYDGVRWKSYSNKFDLQGYAAKTRTKSHCQFLLKYSYYEVQSGFVKGTIHLRPLLDGPFFGRVVDPDHVDLDLCRKWLEICDISHSGPFGQCAGKRTLPQFLRQSLRLIDVDRRIIVKGLPHRGRYVTLSYVWGKDKVKRELPTTTKAIVKTDERGVETIALPESLPRTIRDAIEVTRQLDFRYLWVDSLCIIQDDDEDIAIQIEMMGEIYSSSSLTIAAGSGHHADLGLPGISRPRNFSQRVETVNGVELAIAFPSYRDLNSSEALVWNSRGWTLQEKVLSRRLLLFTDLQVYYRCANSVCAEDIAMEAGSLSTDIRRRSNPFEWGAKREMPGFAEDLVDLLSLRTLKLKDDSWHLTFFPNYVALVAEFTQRTFTSKLDTLKAITGVLSTLDHSKHAFPGGLPRAWFADALLWQPGANSKYSVNSLSSSFGIPTWSWAAWSLSKPCVWLRYARDSGTVCGGPRMAMHMESGGIGVESYHIPYGGWIVGQLVKEDFDFASSASSTVRQQLKQSGVLLSFCSQVRTFKIGKAIPQLEATSDDTLQTFYLLDLDNLKVGKVWTSARIARMPNDHQFVALSIRKSGVGLEHAVDEKYQRSTVSLTDPETGATWYKREGPPTRNPSTWNVVNVMLVKWESEVAFRVAVGEVISSAWGRGKTRLVYLG